MDKTNTVYIVLRKDYFNSGEQVEGNVFLNIENPISSAKGIELIVREEEKYHILNVEEENYTDFFEHPIFSNNNNNQNNNNNNDNDINLNLNNNNNNNINNNNNEKNTIQTKTIQIIITK